MKNSSSCPKCGEKKLMVIPKNIDEKGHAKSIPAGFWKERVYIANYICSKCGFLEEWINSEEDLEALVKKHLP